MAFEIDARRNLAKQVRQVACKRLDKALTALRTKSREPRLLDEAVHTSRRHIREVRALLRLARDALGKRIYERENDTLREVFGHLSDVRDAKALVDAFRSLEVNF